MEDRIKIWSCPSCPAFDPAPCKGTWEDSRGQPNYLGYFIHVGNLEEVPWFGPALDHYGHLGRESVKGSVLSLFLFLTLSPCNCLSSIVKYKISSWGSYLGARYLNFHTYIEAKQLQKKLWYSEFFSFCVCCLRVSSYEYIVICSWGLCNPVREKAQYILCLGINLESWGFWETG